MVTIEFSVMENSAGDAQQLRPLLDAFEKQYHVHVNLIGIPWSKGWTEIAKFGIFGHGPDLSSIGTTWVGSLASMQALRPFSAQQVHAMGGAEAFFETNWQAGFLPNDPTPWSIPWLGDAMVLYYWKDAFQKAGIDDLEAAFASDTALIATLKKLQAGGYHYPLALTTGNDPVILHETAHWIWNTGGDFMTPDYHRVAFNQPAALEGLRNYFSLRPFISPKSLAASTAEEMFIKREAVVQVAGPWLGMLGRQRHPEWHGQLGIAQLPGKAYVGGSSFVIWQYALHPQEAFELIHFLGHQPATFPASPHDHLVPPRRDVMHMPIAAEDEFNRIYLQALQIGKGFPTIRLWGSVEDRLVTGIANIWAERYSNPNEDLDACMHRHLDPLAQRLNMTLNS
jgi:ABC-type glycerol-3-phosphate transport system substrate-binding protein